MMKCQYCKNELESHKENKYNTCINCAKSMEFERDMTRPTNGGKNG